MMAKSKKSPLSRTFAVAFYGIGQVIKKERNMKIHLVISILAVFLGLFFGLTQTEWLVLVLTIFVVFSAEVFNSAIEGICNLARDKLKLTYLETKLIRDMSAGAVLLLAIAAVIVALLIFLPYLLALYY